MDLNQSPITSKYIHKRQKNKERKSHLQAAKQVQSCSAELSHPVADTSPKNSLPHTDIEKNLCITYQIAI